MLFRRSFMKWSTSPNISHSATVVRKYDRDGYLCTLLLPSCRQNFAYALRAVNIELAQIRDKSKSMEHAQFRFQYWRDVIRTLSDSSQVNGSPIEQARFRHFNECGFDSLRSVQNYAEETNASIHYLLAESYNLTSLEVDHALSHLGHAQGLVNLLRGSVFLARNRCVVLLPLDVLDKHRVTQEAILRALRSDHTDADEFTSNMCDIYYDLACAAREQAINASRLASDQLQKARDITGVNNSSNLRLLQSLLPRLMLPLVSVFHFLDQLENIAHFDPRRVPTASDGLLPLRLTWTAFRNKIPSPKLRTP
ncbi:unnamed protein product [Dicrocoelium dendriticum]|nr:unnamed protein product [Dicrocoelium dendriticum]